MNGTWWFSTLMGVAFKGCVILAAAWVPAFLLRRHSAAWRHLVWSVALAAALGVPLLSVLLPALRVPAPALAASPAGPVFRTSASAGGHSTDFRGSDRGERAGSIPSSREPDWRFWVIAIWAAGAAGASIRTWVGWRTVRRLRRGARPFAQADLCRRLSGALGIRRTVVVLEAGAGTMPVSFGIRQPVVLVPSELGAWDEQSRRIVLLHELAHVRRGDAATHLLARAALALYWWNPLAWIAWREFLKERERAADDLVLNAGTRPSEYAAQLLEVARTMRCGRALGYGYAAMARCSQLEGRLAAILDGGARRTAPSRAAMAAAVVLAAMAAAPVAAVRAQEDPPKAVPEDLSATIRAARSEKNYQVLEKAAKTAEELRQYDTARQLLESAAAIRAEVSGDRSADYGLGLLSLAGLAWRHGGADAVELYGKAAEILADRPEGGQALTYLGIAEVKKKNFPLAFDHFQRARNLDPARAGAALMWMAVVRQREQNIAEAERFYQSALSVQDPKSPDAAVTMELYSSFLKERGRDAEAGELEARAAAVQAAGVPESAPSRAYKMKSPGVTPPSVLKKVEPEYSEEARAARLQGTLITMVDIGRDGAVQSVRIVKGLGLGLDQKALEAIRQWQFKPGLKDGHPVPVAATIEVNWRLL